MLHLLLNTLGQKYSIGMHEPISCALLPTLISSLLYYISMNKSTFWLCVGKEAQVGAPCTCLEKGDKPVGTPAT